MREKILAMDMSNSEAALSLLQPREFCVLRKMVIVQCHWFRSYGSAFFFFLPTDIVERIPIKRSDK
jgi:hypothetical protein